MDEIDFSNSILTSNSSFIRYVNTKTMKTQFLKTATLNNLSVSWLIAVSSSFNYS